MRKYLVGVFFLFLILAGHDSVGQNLVPDDVEFQVLKDLFDNTAGSGWTTKTNWPTTGNWPASATSAQFGTWFGVTVSNGDITRITLTNNKLTGPIPSSIGNLSQLTRLVLNQNSLNGSIPSSIGSLSKLENLWIENNKLTGSIPVQLGNVTTLKHIYLYSNQLTGGIPTELGNLTALQSLLLHNNALGGTIPSSLNNLQNLTRLHLSACGLTGSIPNLGSLTNLVELGLATNNFTTGPIPSWISNLVNLTSLNLTASGRTGTIPSGLSALSGLRTFYLNENQLSGSIPSWIGGLTNLRTLNLSENQLTGPIPSQIGSLSLLTALYLGDNLLSGSLPSTWAGMTSLLTLSLLTNQLSGELPPSIGSLSTLTYFDVSHNQFSGSIPAQYAGLVNISTFNVSYNNLGGNLPANLFTNWTKLSNLTITTNSFTGDFPSSIGSCTSLAYASLTYNKFTSLPTSLLNLSLLGILLADNNQITTIPSFSTHPNRLGLDVKATKNQLSYDQINLNRNIGLHVYTFSPQNDIVDLQGMNLESGQSLVLNTRPLGPANTGVTWQKKDANGAWVDLTNDEDGNPTTYTRSNAASADMGTYRWRMQDGQINSFILQSGPIIVGENVLPVQAEEFRARSLTPTSALLNWQTTGSGNTGFKLERKADGEEFYEFATVGATATSYTDGTLQPGTGYTYRIKSYNNAGQSFPREAYQKTFTKDAHYILETTVLKKTTDVLAVEGLQVGEQIRSWTYLDGEGRTIQQLGQQVSPGKKDEVSFQSFDPLGRPVYQHMSYTVATQQGAMRNAPADEQKEFYNGTSTPAGVAIEAFNPYGEVKYEQTPLSRVKEQASPGYDWQMGGNNTTKVEPGTNDIGEVRVWTIVESNGIALESGEAYAAAELVKQTVTNGERKTVTYTDKLGRVILKKSSANATATQWVSTYFVYNNYGEVAYQLTPLAVEKAQAASWQISETLANNLCFSYKYDNQGRTIEEKAPGTAAVYFVYDNWGRLALSQDGNQRVANKWSFSKYDEWNRVIMTGVVTDAASLETLRTNYGGYTQRFETRSDNAGNVHGYTNTTHPQISDAEDVLSIIYYDNYSFLGTQLTGSYGYSATALTDLPASESGRTQGATTASKTKIITSAEGEAKYLWTVSYFDDEQQPIQVISQNHLDGIDRSSMTYNFPGWVMKSNTIHFENNTAKKITIGERFDYDHTGRLLRTYHQVNTKPEVLVSELSYNELGQVIRKELHKEGSTMLQAVDYDYTLQGWLKGINTTAAKAGDPVDYYVQELGYNQAIGTGNIERYDGLISGTKWKNDTDTKEHAYNYNYDARGQLRSASYKRYESGIETLTGLYTEDNITYDANGNIQTLNRNGNAQDVAPEVETPAQIDQLQYTYAVSSNQLVKVTDGAPADDKTQGFNDGNTTGDDYTYDANGNLVSDENKGISVTYNILDLPETVTFADDSKMKYIYTAGGVRLGQEFYNTDDAKESWTDYAGPVVYENNTASYLPHSEGRYVTPDGDANAGVYQYYLTDHLGSVRVVLSTQLTQSSLMATMEEGSSGEQQFLDYEQSARVSSMLFDHTDETPGGGKALRINNTLQGKRGMAASVSVMPGDTVRMSVFGKYLDQDKSNWSEALQNLAYIALSGGTTSAGVIDGAGMTTPATDTPLPFGAVLNNEDDTEGPRAHLNWLFFDRNFVMKDGGYKKLSDAAKEDGTNVAHEELSNEVIITEPGYVYVYLSNESDESTEVFFDDFSVTVSESPVIQINDYYAYGMSAYTWTRENEKETKEKFQGKEYDAKTGWHDFHARQYDATLGRWFAVDPQNQFASGYVGMGNNPVVGVDPDGKFFFVPILVGAVIGGVINVGIQSLNGNIDFSKKGWGWDMAASFGIGALAGGASVLVPQAIGTIAGYGLTTATGAVAGGFIPGAVAGGVGGFAGEFGNKMYFDYDDDKSVFNNLGNSFLDGLAGAGMGALTGGLIGGGLNALKGKSFWGDKASEMSHMFRNRVSDGKGGYKYKWRNALDPSSKGWKEISITRETSDGIFEQIDFNAMDITDEGAKSRNYLVKDRSSQDLWNWITEGTNGTANKSGTGYEYFIKGGTRQQGYVWSHYSATSTQKPSISYGMNGMRKPGGRMFTNWFYKFRFLK